MGKKKNKKKQHDGHSEIRSPQPMFPQTVDYVNAVHREMTKLMEETVANLKAEPAPIPGLQELVSGSATRTGSFGVEYCAGSAFVLGLDGTRWFTTTQLRAETIATVLNRHLDEFLEVRADILKSKNGVEV